MLTGQRPGRISPVDTSSCGGLPRRPLTVLGTLGTQPGWQWSAARAMNASGQVVGSSQVSLGDRSMSHAFLYQQGTMIDLNSLIPSSSGVTLLAARFINNAGQIVAQGDAQNGTVHNYLLTPMPDPAPIPEPGTLTVFGVFAGALALRRTCRRGPSGNRGRTTENWFVGRARG